nr:nitrous oxide reductase maturation transmembrane protein [uncultured bacterium]
MLGVIYYYNIQEFLALLLSQPIKRSNVFLGHFLGLVCSLILAILIGIGIPFLIYGVHVSDKVWDFGMLLLIGVLLSFIFSGIAFLIGASNSNRIKGFGFAIVFWLFMAVLYDGIFLLVLVFFHEYPLENTSIVMSMFNPIDLSRTLMMLKLDLAALLGYTGAVFSKLFGTSKGMILALSALMLWATIPIFLILKKTKKKDF